MLNRDDPTPLYQQLENIIRDKIEGNEWKPNDLILSKNELSKIYGVSRMTARSVVLEFVRKGYLYRVPGKGTYVANFDSEKKIKKINLNGLVNRLEQLDSSATTKLKSVGVIHAPAYVKTKLCLPPKNGNVLRVSNIGYIDNRPVGIYTAYIPLYLFKGIEDENYENERVTTILNREYHAVAKRALETLEMVTASKIQAKILKVEMLHPLIKQSSVMFNEDDVPFKYMEVIYQGDKIKLEFEIIL